MKSLPLLTLQPCNFGEVKKNVIDILISDITTRRIRDQADHSAQTVINRIHRSVRFSTSIQEDIDELIANRLNLYRTAWNLTEVIYKLTRMAHEGLVGLSLLDHKL